MALAWHTRADRLLHRTVKKAYGEPVTFTCAGHAPVNITCPFDAPYATALDPDVPGGGVSGVTYTLDVILSDLPAMPQPRDTVLALPGAHPTRAGKAFKVSGVQPDGLGMAKIQLTQVGA